MLLDSLPNSPASSDSSKQIAQKQVKKSLSDFSEIVDRTHSQKRWEKSTTNLRQPPKPDQPQKSKSWMNLSDSKPDSEKSISREGKYKMVLFSNGLIFCFVIEAQVNHQDFVTFFAQNSCSLKVVFRMVQYFIATKWKDLQKPINTSKESQSNIEITRTKVLKEMLKSVSDGQFCKLKQAPR